MNNQPLHTEEFVTLSNGHKLWVQQSISGETPVLLIHGGPGGSSGMLQPVEEALRKQGYQTIVYHQLGSVNSDNPDEPGLWTIEDFTNHLEQVCDALNLKKFYIFGYSWGVVLALEYAIRHPKRLHGMILSNFTASSESFETYAQLLRTKLSNESKRTLDQLEKINDFTNPAWVKIITEEFMPKHFCILKPWPSAFSAFMEEMNWKICHHFFGKNDFAVKGAIKGWNRWADLPNINIPTLILSGASDQCSPADAKRMGSLMPKGSAHIIPRASHVPFYENPSDYFEHLTQFLKNNKQNEN